MFEKINHVQIRGILYPHSYHYIKLYIYVEYEFFFGTNMASEVVSSSIFAPAFE